MLRYSFAFEVRLIKTFAATLSTAVKSSPCKSPSIPPAKLSADLTPGIFLIRPAARAIIETISNTAAKVTIKSAVRTVFIMTGRIISPSIISARDSFFSFVIHFFLLLFFFLFLFFSFFFFFFSFFFFFCSPLLIIDNCSNYLLIILIFYSLLSFFIHHSHPISILTTFAHIL